VRVNDSLGDGLHGTRFSGLALAVAKASITRLLKPADVTVARQPLFRALQLYDKPLVMLLQPIMPPPPTESWTATVLDEGNSNLSAIKLQGNGARIACADFAVPIDCFRSTRSTQKSFVKGA